MTVRAPRSNPPAFVMDRVVGGRANEKTLEVNRGSTRLPTLLIEMANDWWSPVLRSLEISSLSARTNIKKKVKLHVGILTLIVILVLHSGLKKYQIVQWAGFPLVR